MKNIRKLITLILAVVSVLAVATTALAAYSTMYVNCPLGETVRLRKTASSCGVILQIFPEVLPCKLNLITAIGIR